MIVYPMFAILIIDYVFHLSEELYSDIWFLLQRPISWKVYKFISEIIWNFHLLQFSS